MRYEKQCKMISFRFEPPFWGIRGNAQGSCMARWKVHCRLPISDNGTFLLALMAEAVLGKYVEIGIFWRGGSLWAHILGRWGRRPQSIYGLLDREWCSYNFAAGSFHTKTLQQTSFDKSWILLAKTAKSRYVPALGELGITYMFHLWLVGKRVIDSYYY